MRFKRLTALFAAFLLTISMIPTGDILASEAYPDEVVGNETDLSDTDEGSYESALPEETAVEVSQPEKPVDEVSQPEESIDEVYPPEESEDAESESEDIVEAETEDGERLSYDIDHPAMVLYANGGQFPNGATYLNFPGNTWDIKLSEVPTREGYAFTGWYKTSECREDELLSRSYPIYKLERAPVGTIAYAGWTDEYWTVTYDMGDGYYCGINSDKRKVTSLSYKIPKTQKDYTCVDFYSPDRLYITANDPHCTQPQNGGWTFTNGGDDVVSFSSYQLDSDVTFYARYEQTHYVVTIHSGDFPNAYFKYRDFDAEGNQLQNVHHEIRVSSVSYSYNSLYMPKKGPDGLYSDNLRKKYTGLYLDEACTIQPEWFRNSECTLPIRDSDEYYYMKVTEDMDLYAGWEVTNYILTLDPNGGFFRDDETNWQRTTEPKQYASEPGVEVTRENVGSPWHDDPHMGFTGWYDNPSAMGIPVYKGGAKTVRVGPYALTEDITYYAGWKNSYKVITFDMNGGSLLYFYNPNNEQEVHNGTVFDLSTNASGKMSYYPEAESAKWTDDTMVFEGWYTAAQGGEKIQSLGSYVFTADTTVYAHWTPIRTITFDANDGRIKEPGKSGTERYETVQCKTDIGGVLPKYKALGLDPRWWADGEISDDYLFEGWYNGEEKIESLETYAPDSDVTLVAHWVPRYTVTFDANGGKIKRYGDELVDSLSYYTTSDGTLSNYLVNRDIVCPNDGMIFSGWYEENDETKTVIRYMYLYKPTGNITLKALYLPIYTVTFDAGDGLIRLGDKNVKTYEVQTNEEGRPSVYSNLICVLPDNDPREFGGWYEEGDETRTPVITLVYKPTKNVVLKAIYNPRYTVTFDANGGYIKQNPGDTKGVSTLQLKTNGYGTLPDYERVGYSALIGHPDTGKNFDGWYTEKTGGKWVDVMRDKFTQDTTLYAHYWESYEVVLDAGAGNIHYYDINVQGYCDVSTLTLRTSNLGTLGSIPLNQNITRKNYTFKGWYIKGTDTKIEDPASYPFREDTVLEAHWGKVSVVTFDANGGQLTYWDINHSVKASSVSYTVPYGERLTSHPYDDVTMPGYDFTGWYLNGIKLESLDDFYPTGDVTIQARFAKQYKIIFDGDGGTFDYYAPWSNVVYKGQKTATFVINSAHPFLDRWPMDPEPYYVNKAFSGWYLGDKKITDYHMIFDRDVTIKARYVDAVAVTFDPAGGYFADEDQTQTYDAKIIRVPLGKAIGDAVTGMPVPLHTDKEFTGWYLDPACDPGSEIDEVSYIPTVNTTVYAGWIETHTVTFDAGSYNGMQGTIPGTNEHTVLYRVRQGASLKSLKNMLIPGVDYIDDQTLVLDGWYDSADEQQKILSDREILKKTIDHDITYVAKISPGRLLRFHANGGQFSGVTPDTEDDSCYTIRIKDGELTGSDGREPVVTGNDKVFAGWYYDASCMMPADLNALSRSGNAVIDLYAGWSDCYTITFHTNRQDALFANGEDMVAVKIVRGEPYRYCAQGSKIASVTGAPALAETPIGSYAFDGWYTDPGCTGTKYSFDQAFIPTEDMDFYIRWTDETVEVTFDANGGAFSASAGWWKMNHSAVLNADHKRWVVSVPKGITWKEIKEQPCDFDSKPAGVQACEWAFTDTNCTKPVQADEAILNPVKVFCKWSVGSTGEVTVNDNCRITYHAGDGYFACEDRNRKTIGGTYGLYNANGNTRWYTAPVPLSDEDTKAFSGWYLDAAGTQPYYDGCSRFRYEDGGYCNELRFPQMITDLYAGYQDAYTVTLHANGGYFDHDQNRVVVPEREMRTCTQLDIKLTSKEPLCITDYGRRVRRDGDLLFGGWYYDPACTAGQEASVYSTDGVTEWFAPKQDVVLYAKWISYEKPGTIKISGTKERKINIGDQITLSASVTGNASASGLNWMIVPSGEGTPACIRLEQNGKVTGLSQGVCNVYATLNGVRSNEVTIRVSNKVVSNNMTLDTANCTLQSGESGMVRVNITPAELSDVLAGSVQWSSSDPSVATVESAPDGSGAVITAGYKEGEAVITAQLGTAKCTVKVKVSCPVKIEQDRIVLTARNGATALVSTLTDVALSETLQCFVIDRDGNSYAGLSVVRTDAGDTVPNDGKRKDVWTVSVEDAPQLYEQSELTVVATVSHMDHVYRDSCSLLLNPMAEADPVQASVAQGSVSRGTRVMLSTATVDAEIYYTTDGSDPDKAAYDAAVASHTTDTCATKRYSDALVINERTTICAYAYKDGRNPGKIASFTYDVNDWGDISDEMRYDLFQGRIGDVPEDLWYLIDGRKYEAAGTTALEMPYTGNSITINDRIVVYQGTRKLQENRDYTVSYSNNTAVMKDPEGKKAPTVKIKGKGNYGGTAAFTFKITEADLAGAVLTSEKTVTVAAGNKVALGNTKPTLSFSGKKLTLNKDYALTYYTGTVEDGQVVANPAKEYLKQPWQTYSIRISAVSGGSFKGEYADTITVKTVSGTDKNVIQVSTLKVGNASGKAITLPYDGVEVTPGMLFDNRGGLTPQAYVYVKSPSDPLVYGKDYTVELTDEDNSSAGTHTFVIRGSENNTGNCYIGEKSGTFEIQGVSLSKVKIAGLNTTAEYTGSAITLSDLFNASEKTITDHNKATAKIWTAVTLYTTSETKENGKKVTVYEPLRLSTDGVSGDYTVSMENNGAVGKFDLVFHGINGYTDTVQKTITIKAYDVNDTGRPNPRINIQSSDAVYSKAGSIPEKVIVRDGDRILLEGIDYTVSYKNNTKIVADYAELKASARPTVVVKGMGNYSGSNTATYFNILKGRLDQCAELTVNDIVFNAKGKAGYMLATPKLTDNGKAVTSGNNKDVDAFDVKKDCAYYYAEDTFVNGVLKCAGSAVAPTDPVAAGTLIKVVLPVTVSNGNSPYRAGTYSMEAYYKVISADISKATVSFVNGYTPEFCNGEPVVPMKNDQLIVKIGTEQLKNSDYEIVSIDANRFPGSATMEIRGRGSYGGVKKFTFTIKTKSMQ
ncbi:MAG: InlB B-repeat-containing protein [Lachnospiraceae bacterium]|nr:InlB B-repeat-containing protein [Lachnospiraceae bacterium]